MARVAANLVSIFLDRFVLPYRRVSSSLAFEEVVSRFDPFYYFDPELLALEQVLGE